MKMPIVDEISVPFVSQKTLRWVQTETEIDADGYCNIKRKQEQNACEENEDRGTHK